MNRLEELAGILNFVADVGHDTAMVTRPATREAAAILLAASKVDVAGLMKLAEAVAIASDEIGRAELRGCRADYQAEDKAFEQLETALRMALAGREWQTLTDDEIYQMYSEPSSDSEMVAFAAVIRSKK